MAATATAQLAADLQTYFSKKASQLTLPEAALLAGLPQAPSFYDPFNRPASLLAAGAVVSTVPIIIIVLIFQRKIVAGLTSGAVKG